MAAEPSLCDEKSLEEQTSSSSFIAAVEVSSYKNKLICNKFNDISPMAQFKGFKDFQFEYPTSLALRRTYRIIEACVEKRVTSLQLRRLARQLIKESLRNQGCKFSGLEYVSLNKPSALHASEMCSKTILTAGACPISDCNLRPEEMRRDHLKMHLDCTDTCYFWQLYNVARCGWSLPNKSFKVKRINDNHPPFNSFGIFSQESLAKQLSVAGAVEEVDGRGLTLNPLLSVVRNSDLWRAHCVGLNVADEVSLLEANRLLQTPIKVRVCLDAGASGQNGSQPDFPFSYASIQDAVSLLTPGCFMAKLDLAHMYLTLGLALDSRKFFGFKNGGRYWRYRRMPFGVKLAAGVLSAFMSEVLEIARSEGVASAIVYMDDWFIVGRTYSECQKYMKIIMAILRRHGWSIEETKTTQPCQLTEFIGIELNSINMTLSIVPEKAQSVLYKFERVAGLLDIGTLTSTLVRSLAGNCMWFSSVLTTGKIYTYPLFKLMRALDSRRVRHAYCCELFCKAYDWWKETLHTWCSGVSSNANVRLVPSQLVRDSIVMQQDAGDEGLGYFWVTVKDNFRRLRFAACVLPFEAESSSSTFKELSTLAWALPRHLEWSDRLVIVVFDSSASAYAINYGCSRSDACLSLIECIYLICDANNITLVALWVPREDNTFSDMLTHICVHNRTLSIEGEFEI